jgi:hypothetical protein
MPAELPPHVTDVHAGPGHLLPLTFSDGSSGNFDVGPFLWGPAFEPVLDDPDAFAAVTVDPEIGTIVWPGGADLAPEFLYDHAVLGQVAHVDHDPREQPVDCARAALWELASGIRDERVRQQTVEHGQAAVAELARQLGEARASASQSGGAV